MQARDDVVTRRTRFSCRASVSTIMDSIESATVAVGGRVARQDGGRCVVAERGGGQWHGGLIRTAQHLWHQAQWCCAPTAAPRRPSAARRLRLYIPNPRGTIHVLAELFEVVPGTHMVDLQKVQGDTGGWGGWVGGWVYAGRHGCFRHGGRHVGRWAVGAGRHGWVDGRGG